MVVFVCVYLYACMNACTHALVAFHLMFFFSMLICVFAIVISQARRVLLVLRSLMGAHDGGAFSRKTIPSSIQVMLHCEASCEEYIVATRLVFCCIVHVCICLVTLLFTHSGMFSLFHANKVMRKD